MFPMPSPTRPPRSQFIDVYLLLAGIYLIILPWTARWILHPATVIAPDLMTSSAFRGFLTGIGILHLYALGLRRG